jgi:hypothetical protein
LRAFQHGYDYYRLKKDCLGLKQGAIFYHDKNDHTLGSIMEGCLKLAWDVDGNCNFGTAGDTYILHASARKDFDYLELIDIEKENDFAKILLDKINSWNKNVENNLQYKFPQINKYLEGKRCAFIKIKTLIELIIQNKT